MVPMPMFAYERDYSGISLAIMRNIRNTNHTNNKQYKGRQPTTSLIISTTQQPSLYMHTVGPAARALVRSAPNILSEIKSLMQGSVVISAGKLDGTPIIVVFGGWRSVNLWSALGGIRVREGVRMR